MNGATPDQLPLRDIHLPDPIGWWPPAPGWWLLLATLILLPLLITLFIKWRRHQHAQGQVKRQVEVELIRIRHDYQQHQDSLQLTQALSALLRRAALSRYPRTDVAGLSGEAWLAFLDHQLNGDDFRQGAGRLLGDTPYRNTAPSHAEAESLLALSQRWLSALPKQRQEAA